MRYFSSRMFFINYYIKKLFSIKKKMTIGLMHSRGLTIILKGVRNTTAN